MLRSLLLLLSLLCTTLASTACLDLDALFAECDSDSDCDDDEECNDDGECEELECTEDDDCDPGEECRRDECKRISCTNDEECGEGAFCDLVDGKCDEIPDGEGEGEGEEGEGEGEGEFGEGEGEGEFGEGEGEGDPCGGVSPEGQCNGDIIERCVDGFVQTANCNSSPFPSGQTDCQFVTAVDRVECAVQAGSQCILSGGTAVALCQGSSPGCRLDDTTSGTCVSSAAFCVSSDEFQCIGSKFILTCSDEAGFGSGQPLYVDCAVSGGTCTPNVGCLIPDGGFCAPDITQCGDSFSPTICPASGVCPGDGGGSFTHNTGIPGDPTFSNDTPIDTSSEQGAIDACNAHFGVTTCGVPCPGSNCTDVTRDANCTCTPPEGLVWHFGDSVDCFTSSNAPGVVSTINSSCTQIDSGNWN
jgi:hypothetical protein